MKAQTKQPLFRLDGPDHLAGVGKIYTMKEWKRIHDYPNAFMCGRLVPVDQGQPTGGAESAPEAQAVAASSQPVPSKCDNFYAYPTPANAVALANADARATGNGTLLFFECLNRAEEQLRDPVRASATDLLGALQASNKRNRELQKWMIEHARQLETELAEAQDHAAKCERGAWEVGRQLSASTAALAELRQAIRDFLAMPTSGDSTVVTARECAVERINAALASNP